ncbi:MAG TPA: hypothetical protein VJJ82_02580 [Candidatus Nanoarchaeia archaeon]|nr:hypothetical protein [Candidatus Nanoarchaeia archaeon]
MVSYKQLCARCKKNMVLIVGRSQFPLCYDCQKSELSGPISDPKMKKLFNIPEDLYRQSSFLRSIKSGYLRFGKLSDKQIEAFKNTVEKIKTKAPESPPTF